MPGEKTLLKVKQALSFLNHVRAEWSLEISVTTVWKRPYMLFWVGNQKDEDNQYAFNQVAGLLESFNCPTDIRDKQTSLAPASITQGIGVPTDNADGQYSLYLHHKYDNIEKYESFKWVSGARRQHCYYKFVLLQEINIASFRNLIKTGLQLIFDNILDDKRLFRYSGIWIKYTSNHEQEIYVTFLWHPPLKEILSKISPFLNSTYEKVRSMEHLNFRHIGFSSIYSDKCCLTFYFSSTISGSFLEKFEIIENNINLGSNILHNILQKQVGLETDQPNL